ncbi:MAG: MerR family transcriptional regulator [Thermodesulfovibrionales bacterium]|nr:MerR family transcriptional regulator [Thermodesulfovibrionales bacterium]
MAKKCETKIRGNKEDRALYPIGVVSEMVGISDQTLRLYEKHGLITPKRRNKHRYYSDNDVKWIKCIKAAIHKDKISIEGLKRLLNYAPCWEIRGCNDYIKKNCRAYQSQNLKCWSISNCSSRDVRCNRCIIKRVSSEMIKPE